MKLIKNKNFFIILFFLKIAFTQNILLDSHLVLLLIIFFDMQKNLDSNCLSIDNQEIITRSPSPTPLRTSIFISDDDLLIKDNFYMHKYTYT